MPLKIEREREKFNESKSSTMTSNDPTELRVLLRRGWLLPGNLNLKKEPRGHMYQSSYSKLLSSSFSPVSFFSIKKILRFIAREPFPKAFIWWGPKSAPGNTLHYLPWLQGLSSNHGEAVFTTGFESSPLRECSLCHAGEPCDMAGWLMVAFG